MEESADLHEEAGKEKEETLANSSPVEEATSKYEVEIDDFCWRRNQKTLNIRLRAI